MRAYNLMILFICICVGITLMFAANLFNVSPSDNYNFSLDSLLIRVGVLSAAGAGLGFGTAAVVGTIFGTSATASYAAMEAFSSIYVAVYVATSTILASITNNFKGLEMIWVFVTLLSTIILLIALIQMATGGMKSHV